MRTSLDAAENDFIIFAWTDKTKRVSQTGTAFFAEKDRGVKIGKKETKIGLHSSETSDVILEGVRVPTDLGSIKFCNCEPLP